MGLSTAGLTCRSPVWCCEPRLHLSLGAAVMWAGCSYAQGRQVGPQPPAAASRPMPPTLFHQARRSRILATGGQRRRGRHLQHAHSTHRRRSRPQGLTIASGNLTETVSNGWAIHSTARLLVSSIPTCWVGWAQGSSSAQARAAAASRERSVTRDRSRVQAPAAAPSQGRAAATTSLAVTRTESSRKHSRSLDRSQGQALAAAECRGESSSVVRFAGLLSRLDLATVTQN